MEATRSEIDTFKIMSNSDFVDWSKGQQIIKSKEPNVIFEEDHSDSDSYDSIKFKELSEMMKKEDDKLSVQSSKSSKSSRSSQSLESHHSSRLDSSSRLDVPSRLDTAINTPLPPSNKSSPEPIPIPPLPASVTNTPIESTEAFPRRTLPVPKKYTADEENEDYEVLAEKEALLQDLLSYERPPNNIKLTRQWNVKEHTLDELQFEYDRIQSELNANQMVDMAKSGIKFGVGGIEMFLKQAGFNAVDGWYKNSCNDMNKYNRPLIKLYKRYWRKTTMSPIMELAFLLFGGLAWTVAQNKMGLGGPSSTPPPAPTIPSMPIPRATEYEPTKPNDAARPPPMMRPPSMAGVSKGPRWTSEPTEPTPKPIAEPVAPPKPEPAPPKTDEKLNNALESISQQNALMLQVLQNMNENLQKKADSRRSSYSSRSSRPSPIRTPQLRVPLKTPTSKRVSTVRSTRAGGNTIVL